MSAKTVTVGNTYLFNETLNVFVRGIQLSLHHKNDGYQLFPATVIQFFESVFVCHYSAPLNCSYYNRNSRKIRMYDRLRFVIMPIVVKLHNARNCKEI